MLEKKQKTIHVLRGMTLIELMITIAIIGIMASVVIISLSSSRTTNDLQAAARQVAASIREVQASALSGKVASGASCQVSWVSGVSSYTAGCSSPNPSFGLPGGVTFESAGSVSFSVPFGVVSASTTLGLVKGGKYTAVCVEASGNVSEKGVSDSQVNCGVTWNLMELPAQL